MIKQNSLPDKEFGPSPSRPSEPPTAAGACSPGAPHDGDVPFDFSPREALLMAKALERELIDKWKVQDAADAYGVRHWGKGYFSINPLGHVTVHPDKRPDP